MSFQYSDLVLDCQSYAKSDILKISIKISNMGPKQGYEIVQVYSGYEKPSVERHHKDLRGFKRISLEANESKTVKFEIPIESLAYYSPESKIWIVDPISYYLWVGPNSNESQALTATFTVE
ncbi:fibronectin type III-like domain-contianing protein [Candidatus Lokiarchaeum ossiferum]